MKICERCEKQHDGKYGSGRFCCLACARSFSTSKNREEISKKISKSIKVSDAFKKAQEKSKNSYVDKYTVHKICKHCGKEFSYKQYAWRKNRTFCSAKECYSAMMSGVKRKVRRVSKKFG